MTTPGLRLLCPGTTGESRHPLQPQTPHQAQHGQQLLQQDQEEKGEQQLLQRPARSEKRGAAWARGGSASLV